MEMAPYLEHRIKRVAEVTDEIARHLRPGDTRRLTLDELEDRGLVVRDDEREIYLKVVDSVADELPRAESGLGLMSDVRMPRIVSQAAFATEMRRLDESIQEEQELHGRLRILETEAGRLRTEIALAGRPVGVTSAIVILAVYSLLGIVAPVVVLALHPKALVAWQLWSLVAVFVGGLFAVLGYVLWYVGTLNNTAASEEYRSSSATADAV